MPVATQIRVEGLKELRRDLRAADRKMDRKVATRIKKAADPIVDDAKARMPSETGTARSSVTSGISGGRIFIKGGKATVPYFGWLDFGTRTPQQGQPRGVGPWKNSGRGPTGGRFIYPAIDDNSAQLITDVRKAVDEALNEVNL